MILLFTEGNRTTPSYVAFHGDERLIGDAAKNQAAMNPKTLSLMLNASLVVAMSEFHAPICYMCLTNLLVILT